MSHSPTSHPLVMAITGGSGALYAVRLLQWLLASGRPVCLTLSRSGADVVQHELGLKLDLDTNRFDASGLVGYQPPWSDGKWAVPSDWSRWLSYVRYDDYFTPLASGSFLTSGMVVCPCSGSTLSGIARGASSNLIHRAAEVHLKERRPLILVPRETPLSLVAIKNMLRAVEAGAVMLPAMPGWYHDVVGPGDLVDFIVARILDQLKIEHQLTARWGSS